jgi:hypothetical protein
MRLKALLFDLDEGLRHVESFTRTLSLLRQSNVYRLVLVSSPDLLESEVRSLLQSCHLPQDYDFITGKETMLFDLSNPAFYVQVVAQLGIEPDETLFISAAWKDKLELAQIVGIHLYHVSEDSHLIYHGTLTDLVRWLAQKPNLEIPKLLPDSVIPNLSGNVGALTHLVRTTPYDYWHQRPDPEEWSILQILTHLIESEEQHQLPRLKQIVDEEIPFIRAPKPPGPSLAVRSHDALVLLEEFHQLRSQTIEYIQSLDESSWQRTARHSVFGMTTLFEMALFTARHDRLHIQQFCQTIGRCSDA